LLATSERSQGLEELFRRSPHTLRCEVAEDLWEWDEIRADRRRRAGEGGAPQCGITRKVITNYGRDSRTAKIGYLRVGSRKSGKQSQTC